MLTYQQTSSPEFSVIVTCYNDGAYIEEAVQSVLLSTFRNYEIIIVDDCSTDPETINKLNSFANNGFRVLRKEVNKGVSDSRNKGIGESKGKYLLTLDADDRILPSYLEKSFVRLEEGYSVVYCNYKRFGLSDNVLQVPEFSFAQLLAGNYIVNCSAFTKNIWNKTGGFDTGMSHYEDWEFWINAASKGGSFYHIDEVLFEYRHKAVSQNIKCADPDYRSEVVKYVCQKHVDSYQKHVVEIVPYLHKMISLLEADNLVKAEYEKSIFGKLKRASDKLGWK
jgi:glycosyltransferase involved in cell wall biosynthesis